jgi:hypothetical protein
LVAAQAVYLAAEVHFTPKQSQYLAYIYAYTRLHRRPPAGTDLLEYFWEPRSRFRVTIPGNLASEGHDHGPGL